MNKSTRNKEVAFAIFVSISVAVALWYTVGQWIIFGACQSTPTPVCTNQAVGTVTAASVIIGVLLVIWNVRRALKR